MLAFIPAIPVAHAVRHAATPRVCHRRIAEPRATLSPADDEMRVRFDRGEDATKTSLSPAQAELDAPATPNDRVLAQVRGTMQRLGVSEGSAGAPGPRPFRPIDVSRVNPLSAFAGAAGAAAMSYAAWEVLGFIIHFFVTHPVSDDIYVVQRITAVVRTVLVCVFALGSGISGVTGLGLFLLGVRTSYGTVSGEFSDKDGKDE